MEYNYNRIFLENRHITNKTTLIWMNILAGFIGILWLLGLMHVITGYASIFYYLMPASSILLVFPYIFSKLKHWSDFANVTRKEINQQITLILACLNIAIFFMCISVPAQYMMIAWLFPSMIACQYYSGRITRYTFFIGLIGLILSDFSAFFIHTQNVDFAKINHEIMVLVPTAILYCTFYPLFGTITKRAELLMKKQKLAIMTSQAKQSFEYVHDLSDTFETDCKIKMRYLAKNGIDVDRALSSMNGNVDKYNDFVLTFVGESHRKEDELFELLESDTLIQYGAKVHALRIKANALGIINLTDTAFFHEMEAYAGNLEIVQANWEKLSFEWDEACDAFTAYIQSLGLNDRTIDKYGRQITYKRWGEQLQEAFDALETCDATKARAILSELLQYQIDSDMAKKLETILANIDDILKA